MDVPDRHATRRRDMIGIAAALLAAGAPAAVSRAAAAVDLAIDPLRLHVGP